LKKSRLEAFSDGVLAIIITIMVLELRAPHGSTLADLRPLAPKVLSYLVSFLYIGIYWNNHHHMLQAVERVDGRVLWANMLLLLWLSLIPFTTAWMGENHFQPLPVALYGVVLLLAAVAYYILSRTLIRLHGPDSVLGRAVGSDVKGKLSLGLYAVSIPLAFVQAPAACAIYVLVAVIWLVPDARIERHLASPRAEDR